MGRSLAMEHSPTRIGLFTPFAVIDASGHNLTTPQRRTRDAERERSPLELVVQLFSTYEGVTSVRLEGCKLGKSLKDDVDGVSKLVRRIGVGESVRFSDEVSLRGNYFDDASAVKLIAEAHRERAAY